MMLIVTDRPGRLGGDDLYAVQREGDGWGNGKWLYFTSHRNGTGDVLRVPMPDRIR
jgi:hypothetical protein